MSPARSAAPFALGGLGLAVGLGAFAGGFFELDRWAPPALVLLFLLAAVAGCGLFVAVSISPRALLAVLGLGLLALWAALSSIWGTAPAQALEGALRWFAYVALLVLLIVTGHRREWRVAPLAGATAGILIVAGYLIVEMLRGAGEGILFDGRLSEPLGYVNAQGSLLVLGIWPLLAVVHATRNPAIGGIGIGGAGVLVTLAALTQSRGVLIALLATAAVLIAVVPRRTRTAWAYCAIAGVVAVSVPGLSDVYAADSGVSSAMLREVAIRALVGALTVGAVWALVDAAVNRRGRSSAPLPRLTRIAPAVVGIAGVAALVIGAQKAPEGWRDFKGLETTSGQSSRVLSGGGNRYDYWGVALDTFRDNPVRGVGQGGFEAGWYRERRVTESITQPHSVELQVLAELGLVGWCGLLFFILGSLGALRVVARRGDSALAIAGGGVFLAWLIHSSVDWMHLIPALTAIALFGVAILLAPEVGFHGHSPVSLTQRAVVAVVLSGVLVGGVTLGRLAIADDLAADARAALPEDPAEALSTSARSLRFSSRPVPPYYTRAAAFERLGEYGRARDALRAGLVQEPDNFVTRALLGDLAVRRGDLVQARREYRRASKLNPLDPELKRLASEPTLRELAGRTAPD